MKWTLPLVPTWLVIGMLIHAQIASSLFETYTGGNLNAWLFLTSFTYDQEFLVLGLNSTLVMGVMGARYALWILFALSSLYTLGKNVHMGTIVLVEKMLTQRTV